MLDMLAKTMFSFIGNDAHVVKPLQYNLDILVYKVKERGGRREG
jgi:hypothetical protein